MIRARPIGLAALVAAWAVVVLPLVTFAQTAPETATERDSTAAGILVVIGAAALLASGMYFWLRDSPADEDAETPGGGDEPLAGDAAASPPAIPVARPDPDIEDSPNQ